MSDENKMDTQWLKKMPKTELHCHMGGAMRLDTVLELADRYGVRLPARDDKELRKQVVFKNRKERSLPAYLEGISICESVMVKAEAFQRVMYEICEDASKENVKVLELRFGPTNYDKRSKLHEVVEAALDGLKRAAEDFHMYTGLIICGIRTDKEATRRAAEIAVNYMDDGVVGFDLAGKEAGNRPRQFIDVIQPVLHNFLPVTIHAGEDDTVGSIAEAIVYLNARRIGHGVSIRESTKLFNYVNKTRLGIEICPTSNVDTGSVCSYATHPVRSYFKRDLRLSINTDNPTISDTSITKEYAHLIESLGFTQHEVFKLAKNGIKSAFLDSRTTKLLLEEFDEFTRRVEKYG